MRTSNAAKHSSSKRILGSLNKDNSSEIFNIRNVDGGLVGGASLFSKSFLPIIQALESATYKS